MPNLKAKLDYKEYLKSAHWQEIRRKYWASNAEKSCHFCKSTKRLALHHKHGYRRMYEENQNHLVLLCAECHRELHQIAGWKLDYKSVWKAYLSLRGKYQKQRRLKK